MKATRVLVTISCAALLIVGCSLGDDDRRSLEEAPTVINWDPDASFELVKPVTRINQLDMGRAIVRRTGGDYPETEFSVLVAPMREIAVGSSVTLKKVTYVHHPNADTVWFVIIK